MSKVAMQLFTLREHTKTAKEFADTLKKISDIGYTAVQLSAVGCMNGDNPEVDAKTARQMLDDNGLKCIATHRPWDALINDTQAEIEFHQIVGCDYAAIGGINGNTHEQSIPGYRQWLQDASKMIADLKGAGIRFGHHNHSKEFAKDEPHGPTLEDILIDEGGDDLFLELDLFWVEHSGTNCISLLERCHGRVPVIHLKDKEALKETSDTRIAPIGEGTLDWKNIIPACEAAGVDWYCVEQDQCYRDAFDCVKSSFDFLTEMGV